MVQHSAGVYYRSIKKLAYDHKEQKGIYLGISSEFLRPVVEGVKVTQYGSEAIIVVTGRQLWFVHSLKLSSMLKEPFQVQEVSVSFRANTDHFVIPGNQEEMEVVIFSHFSQPIMKNVCVELDVSLIVACSNMVYILGIRSLTARLSTNNHKSLIFLLTAKQTKPKGETTCKIRASSPT